MRLDLDERNELIGQKYVLSFDPTKHEEIDQEEIPILNTMYGQSMRDEQSMLDKIQLMKRR